MVWGRPIARLMMFAHPAPSTSIYWTSRYRCGSVVVFPLQRRVQRSCSTVHLVGEDSEASVPQSLPSQHQTLGPYVESGALQHTDSVRAVAWRSDGVLASGSDDKTIALWG